LVVAADISAVIAGQPVDPHADQKRIVDRAADLYAGLGRRNPGRFGERAAGGSCTQLRRICVIAVRSDE